MSASDGASTSNSVEEPVYFSGDVTRIAGVSPHQLRWLDERQIVSPRKEDHRRKYAPQQVLEILAVAALRRKGLSLQRIKRVLRLLRREWGQHSAGMAAGPDKLYLLTNGDSIHLEAQPEGILDRLAGAKTAMYLVCLSDLSRTITSEKPARRSRTRQLPLF
jgi:DNA-binding transcriptional MerR regulator